jgi:hypothetical protein
MMLDEDVQEEFDIKDLSSIPPYDEEEDIAEFVNQVIENYDWDSFYTSRNIESNAEELLDWVTENVNVAEKPAPIVAWEAVNHLYQHDAFPHGLEKEIEQALGYIDERITSVEKISNSKEAKEIEEEDI